MPEPSTWIMLGFLGLGVVFSCSTHDRALRSIRTAGLLFAAAGASTWLAGAASAALTVDRFYEFGDLPAEDAAANMTVGSGSSNPAPGSTLDSDGTSGTGDLQDLQVNGNPTYVDVAGRPMGGTGLGIKFDGNDSLIGDGLGFPQGAMPNPNADYSGIFTRGFMGWVKPDAAGLGNGTRQDVVTDTQQFQFYIDENDNFAMRHGVINLAVREREVSSELTAQADQWYHFHLHSYGTQPGVLYINGLAEAVVGSFYGGAGLEDMGVGANQFADDFFFAGTLDDLTMYVAGVNVSDFDFGAFDVLQDNPFMAQALAGFVDGDLNGDGVVQGDGTGALGDADDVETFIDNGSFEKLVPGSDLDNESIMLSVGDMETRLKGDFNLDGVTDLLDWGILRNLHPDGPSLDLNALLAAQSVPEPSSGVMLSLLVSTWLLRRRAQA